MLEKPDNEKHFSWWFFILQMSLLFFLVTLFPSEAFFTFLSSHGFSFSSLLITIAVMFVSTFVFFLRFFKRKTRLCSAERFQEEEADNNDDDEDDDDGGDDENDEDGLIEIALVSEEKETMEAMRKNNQSRRINKIDEDQEEEIIDDVNMEEDNFIEIDISIGSIKRRI